jgi:hypothetical protein
LWFPCNHQPLEKCSNGASAAFFGISLIIEVIKKQQILNVKSDINPNAIQGNLNKFSPRLFFAPALILESL